MSAICTILMTCMVVCADVSGYSEYPKEDPKPAIVEEVATQSIQTQETQSTQSTQSVGFKLYTIHGIMPSEELQRYLYGKLSERGIAWYMPYAVCQIWQESRWNPESTNGRDHGLCQQKGIYWDGRAAAYGIPGASIWDPYAQLHVYACMMAGYLAATGGDVGRALSMYYLGTDGWAQNYVDAVTGHLNNLN